MTDKFKLNFNSQLFDYPNDKPMTEFTYGAVNGEVRATGEIPVTARVVAQRALMNAFKGDEDMPGNTKADHYAIGIKLATRDDVELTKDELEKIKERVRKNFPPVTSGQIDALIMKTLG